MEYYQSTASPFLEQDIRILVVSVEDFVMEVTVSMCFQ